MADDYPAEKFTSILFFQREPFLSILIAELWGVFCRSSRYKKEIP
ncbi:MAG: hypothetical protein V1844_14485 [Pseudomonadota bacterium]